MTGVERAAVAAVAAGIGDPLDAAVVEVLLAPLGGDPLLAHDLPAALEDPVGALDHRRMLAVVLQRVRSRWPRGTIRMALAKGLAEGDQSRGTRP